MDAQDWLEVSVVTSPEAVEAVSEMLMDQGANGVVIDDPRVVERRLAELGTELIDEPGVRPMSGDAVSPGSDSVTVKAYLSVEAPDGLLADLAERVRRLAQMGLDPGVVEVSARRVRDEDWAHSWKEFYTVQHIGHRFVIVPSWITYAAQPGEVIVHLDPGMAFGTGIHPSTRLCLEVLEQTVAPGTHVLDVGTGSGILAIAAAKLGARVHALDIDPRAVSVARDNIGANGVMANVTVATGSIEDVQGMSFDIIVANIIADTIIDILPKAAQLLHPRGCFVASGIVVGRLEDVRTAWAAGDLVITEERQDDEWCCVIGGFRS
ncbi:MAG: 50S ribosomal protein L11 methyltransferase [Limnochordia bacterium]